MGRSKSHNKAYITMTEWVHEFGGKKVGEKKSSFRPLPFYCCSLSLQHVEEPVSNDNGNIFDLENIKEFLKKYGKDPVTGNPSTIENYFPVNFYKNQEDEYHCPILEKVFTDFSNIVVIKTTGNVYSYDAVKKLNIEAKNWIDLITDKPFTKSDIITIQDPVNRTNKNALGNFHFIKEGIEFDLKSSLSSSTVEETVNVNDATLRIFKQLQDKGIPLSEKDQEIKIQQELKEKEGQQNSVVEKKLITEEEKKKQLFEQFKKDKAEKEEELKKRAVQAPSFTSTGYTKQRLEEEHPSLQPGKHTKRKGYVQLKTNLGDINLMLHCDLVPKACENFLEHCENKFYDGTIFHRLIKNFMIQGGDPTGTGTGGQSIWDGKPFKDEFNSQLKHNERGVLSMANHGTNTNGSQFFITFRECKHLDQKHTVFGKVVGGLEVLKTMELVKTDQTDKPNHSIKILAAKVIQNPFRTLDEEQFEEKLKQEKKQRDKLQKSQVLDDQIEGNQKGLWFSNPTPELKQTNDKSVGKYLQSNNSTTSSLGKRLNELPPPKNNNSSLKENIIKQQEQQKKQKSSSYGNFSNW